MLENREHVSICLIHTRIFYSPQIQRMECRSGQCGSQSAESGAAETVSYHKFKNSTTYDEILNIFVLTQSCAKCMHIAQVCGNDLTRWRINSRKPKLKKGTAYCIKREI